MVPFAPSHVDEDNISICTELLSDEEHEYMDDEFPISNDEDDDEDDDDDDDNPLNLERAEPESGSESGAESDAGSDEGAAAGDEAEDEDDDVEGSNDASGPKKTVYGNFGWADAMSKVLKVGKPKMKKSIILAKAKKDADIMKTIAEAKKEEPLSFKIDGEIKETKPQVTESEDVKKPETHTEKMLRRQRRKEWDLVGRVLPDIAADRERERVLTKIGTRGVVQLFNSVKIQQKTMQDRLREAGPLERKREKALKSMNKSDFLDLLQGGSKNKKVKSETVQIKEEPSTWNVLRDDFMPEVKMRDWDKVDSTDSDDNT